MKNEHPGTTAYKALLQAVQRKGHYFIVPRRLSRSIGINKASVLMYLLNVGQANANAHGWIMATPRFIEKGVGIPEERQERMLMGLQRDGLLEFDRRGGKQWVKINGQRVLEVLQG